MISGQFRWGAVEGGWRKGPWTAKEDRLLIQHIRLRGEGKWNSVSSLTGLKRNGKSCRLRWVNYLRPDLKREKITPEEERIIIGLHAKWGNRWSMIARYLPGRTDNEIKNYWRTHFKKARCTEKVEKGRAICLVRQQQEQQQRQREEPQEQQVDVIRKILSLLEEEDEYWLASTPPQLGVLDFVCYRPYMLQSGAASSFDGVSIDGVSWGYLWDAGDVQDTAAVPPACISGAQQQHSSSCYMGGFN